MAVTLQLEMVTPEKRVLSEEITTVAVPGLEGDFGVLPGHAPFISAVRAGEVTIGDVDGKHFAVSDGYAEVLPDRVTLLVDQAVAAGDIDLAKAKSDREDLEEELKDLASKVDQESAEYKLVRRRAAFAQAQVYVAEKNSKKR
ncbi:ATP synthase F1 subunit epsilon [Magnetococcales bacterium HHB-1]